ncbi:MAG TPA: class I mannose-6-phosphate isomerase, partial [Clostridiales bacterium]|nr:class I mannose-6-phosphate isomerase [Clostridiales bacterium]
MNTYLPLKMEENRVWRIYLGGKLLDEFRGVDGNDGYFPEDWLASVVEANNPDREGKPAREGLSSVILSDGQKAYLKDLIDADPEGYLGEDHIENFGVNFGVLTKFLDSAERLPIQVHPDKEAARNLFNSDYGKTEAWYILGGRKIKGEDPYILLGFKEEVSKEQLKELFDKQDIKGMEALMHKIPVEAGEVYIITGGTPHAIGPGCFLLEIQEPTDYTISLEKCNTLGEKLPDFLCHQGLGFDKMFDCFHYTKHSLNELIKEFKLEGSTLAEDENHSYKQVISYETTTCFMLNRLRVKDKYERKNIGRPYAFAVTAGEGKIAGIDVKTGDCLFVPAKTADFFISNSGEDTFELLECLPPEMKNK